MLENLSEETISESSQIKELHETKNLQMKLRLTILQQKYL